MKSIKRIIALLLTAVMTMTMSVTAFAAEPSCSLTVNVKGGQESGLDLKGQTINLYKLFDVTTSQSGNKTNYAYTVNDTYKATLAATLNLGNTATNEALVEKVSGLDKTSVQKFANDFTAKALTSSLAATATSGKIKDSSQSYTFNNLATGYYLVYLKCGKEIQSSLVTVDESTKTVNLKTEAPSITKTANKPSVNIGDVVTYTVKGSVPDTTGYDKYVYTIHDELSNGLDFVKNAKGDALDKANEVNVTVAFKDATDASTAPTTAKLDAENNRKMSLDLSAWVRANQVNNKGKEFTVTYYAKVNKAADVSTKNKATLEYGNKPGETTTTTPSEAKTPTYHLDINKIKTGSKEKLAGAKFSLYTSETDAKNGTNPIKVTGSNGNYVVNPESTTTEFESVKSIDVEGYNLRVNGLAEGTYYLVETKAPDGFNKLTAPIKVEITKSTTGNEVDWTLSKDNTPETDKIIDVENSTGSILPSTGGMGTIAFTVVAALLVLGVAVSFIRDRKKEN